MGPELKETYCLGKGWQSNVKLLKYKLKQSPDTQEIFPIHQFSSWNSTWSNILKTYCILDLANSTPSIYN